MSIQESRQSETALNDLFEQEARQFHGQYTHIEPEDGDLGSASTTPRSRHSTPTADDERELMIWDVYEGDRSICDEPVKESPYGEGVMLSAVDDPENVLWITSTAAWDLDDCL